MNREVESMSISDFKSCNQVINPSNFDSYLATTKKETGNKSCKKLLPFSGTSDVSIKQEKGCDRRCEVVPSREVVSELFYYDFLPPPWREFKTLGCLLLG